MLVELANDMDYHKGKDKYGNDWHIRNNENGTQDWVNNLHVKAAFAWVEKEDWIEKCNKYLDSDH